MEIPVGEVEFRANYSLFELGEQTLASPFAAIGLPSFAAVEKTRNDMDAQLKKLDIYYTHLKVNIANGESFLQPLQSCLSLLEKTVAVSYSKAHSSLSGTAAAAPSSPGGVTPYSDNVQIEVSQVSRTHLHHIYNIIFEKLLVRFPKIQQQQRREMGVLVLDILCLIMTLDSDLCPIFPQSFASSLLFFGPTVEWPEASREVVDRLCYYVMPKCLSHSLEGLSWQNMSAPIMMVLEGCPSTKDHLLLVNTLMQLKKGVCLDVLSVIAYGTTAIRPRALDLLLHFWPIPIQEFSQRSNANYGEWMNPVCENRECQQSKKVASMVCLDPLCVAHHKQGGSTKLYILLCPECDNTVHGSPPNRVKHVRLRVPRPLHDVKPNCEFQKICSGKERQVNRADVTCYDSSCTAIQQGQPIRMCRDCHNKQHKDLEDPRHIYQVCPPDPWGDENQTFASVMVEAVSKLLEVTPTKKDLPARPPQNVNYTPTTQIEVGISREGWWMLSHYCTPTTKVRDGQRSWLVHLLALAMNWLQTYYNLLHDAVSEELQGSVGGNYVVGTVDPRLHDFSRHFANYPDVSNLVALYALPWLRQVCESNKKYVLEVLKPELSDSAQVGKLWNECHNKMKRYHWTLGYLHTLHLLVQEGKLPSVVFLYLFEHVMPKWMELLYSLRAEPGKMDLLQDQFVRILSHEKHDERLKLFNFVWEYFRDKDPEGMKKALFWLQDLTRLKVPIAYLRHMFEDALKEKQTKKISKKGGHVVVSSYSSSFDQEAEGSAAKKDSVTSFSGYDSESALVSQSSLDMGGLITFNSSLTRFILMLDIWLCQLLELQVNASDSFALYQMMVKMLRHMWGSNHTLLDHHDPSSNLCFLCRAMELWFGLATKLVVEYTRKEREDSMDEGMDDVASPISNRPSSGRSLKIKEKITTPKRRRKFVSSGDNPNIHNVQRPKMKKMSEAVELQSFRQLDEDGVGNPVVSAAEPQRQAPVQRRRVAKVHSHSSLEVVSTFGGGAVGGDTIHAVITEEEEISIPPLYESFQLTIEKFGSKLHPDTSISILQWLSTLIRSCKVLDSMVDKKRLLEDLRELFKKLWRSLETDTSNVARSCVGLILNCVDYMASNLDEEEKEAEEEEEEEEDDGERVKSKIEVKEKGRRGKGGKKKRREGIFWQTLRDGLTSQNWSIRFKTIEKLSSILQFMQSTDVVGMACSEFHVKIKHSLAHSFCLFTHLLQDRNSNVCARARYCLTSIKETSLEVTSNFMTLLFHESPSHRSLIFHTLSLLDSALPELHFLNLDLLNNLMNITIQGSNIVPKDVEVVAPPVITKKISETSLPGSGLLKGTTPKVSTSSSTCPLFEGVTDEATETAYLSQQVLSLLLRHIGNPRANVRASMQKAQQSAPQAKKGATIKKLLIPTTSTPEEVFVSLLRHNIFEDLKCFPHELRKNLLLDIFLNHIFPVLDHNIKFGQTKGLLTFILQLLCHCAAPNRDDFIYSDQDDRHSKQDPQYGLAHLPSNLQAPWLRVFFVILYKYIHDYSDCEPSLQNKVYFLCRWCMVITLNSMQYTSHVCPLLNSATGQAPKPSLQRQRTIESLGSDGGTPATPPAEAIPVRSISLGVAHKDFGGGLGAREKGGGLTPVPEDLEGAPHEGEREKREDGEEGNRLGGGNGGGGNGGGGRRSVSKKIAVSKTESSLSEKASDGGLLQPGRCVVCGKPANELSEEVVALCAVAVGTFCNRLPHMVPRYLVGHIIPAISKVITPGFFNWQKNDSLNIPGSASSVARHILTSILAQFGERRLFLYVFGQNHGKLKDTVFQAIACSLENAKVENLVDQSSAGGTGGGGGGGGADKDGEQSLYRSSPVKYFLQDALTSQDMTRYSIINLAAYFTALIEVTPPGIDEPPVLLTRDLPLWDAFFKKLRTQSEILRDQKAVSSLFQVLIILFRYTIDCQVLLYPGNVYLSPNAFQSVTQSLISIIEVALHSVYCPLGGVVQLGGMWYKVFQNNQREAEKLMKMLIVELRKALKARNSSAELVRPDNFLVLIQLFLLEENGYLGYVDGLTDEKLFAPELKERFETHGLSVIQSSQWDFTDALHFLSSPAQCWTHEMVPQLKLSLAQWIALRVQHTRDPEEKLQRILNGDFKSLLPSTSKSGSGQVQWQSAHQTLHILSWLMLGALSHNTIHSVAADVRSMASSGGTCYLLKALLPRESDLLSRILTITRTVLQAVVSDAEQERSDKLEVTFMFCAIFTVYLELYMPMSGPLVLEFWEKICGCLYHQLVNNELETTFCDEVIHSLDGQVVASVRMLGLSCYSLLLPVWQELAAQALPNRKLTLGQKGQDAATPLSVWFDMAVRDLFRIEIESIQT